MCQIDNDRGHVSEAHQTRRGQDVTHRYTHRDTYADTLPPHPMESHAILGSSFDPQDQNLIFFPCQSIYVSFKEGILAGDSFSATNRTQRQNGNYGLCIVKGFV